MGGNTSPVALPTAADPPPEQQPVDWLTVGSVHSPPAEGVWDGVPERDMLGLGDLDALGDCDGEALVDGDVDADVDGEVLLDGETLGKTLLLYQRIKASRDRAHHNMVQREKKRRTIENSDHYPPGPVPDVFRVQGHVCGSSSA